MINYAGSCDVDWFGRTKLRHSLCVGAVALGISQEAIGFIGTVTYFVVDSWRHLVGLQVEGVDLDRDICFLS